MRRENSNPVALVFGRLFTKVSIELKRTVKSTEAPKWTPLAHSTHEGYPPKHERFVNLKIVRSFKTNLKIVHK